MLTLIQKASALILLFGKTGLKKRIYIAFRISSFFLRCTKIYYFLYNSILQDRFFSFFCLQNKIYMVKRVLKRRKKPLTAEESPK